RRKSGLHWGGRTVARKGEAMRRGNKDFTTKVRLPLLLLVVAFAAILLPAADDAGREVFIDDRFEDFAAGKLDAGGQNLYVSRDGKVRTINRFDLNDDCHTHLLFHDSHDTYQVLPATARCVSGDL